MSELKEVWKDIEGYEGLYQISSFGRVKSIGRGMQRKDGSYLPIPERILKTAFNAYGYPMVTLCKDRIQKQFFVHRLVARAFIPNPENKPMVNHINGIKTDNRIKNLEWATASENNQHALDNELRPVAENNYNSKFTNEQAKFIRSEYVYGSKTHGLNALAKKYGVNRVTIHNIVTGRTYKNI